MEIAQHPIHVFVSPLQLPINFLLLNLFLIHRRYHHVGGCNMPNPFVSDLLIRLHIYLSEFLALRIFWGLDGTLQDLYNNFNGVGNNTPTYVSPGYNGAGSCLWLTRSSSQAVIINTPPFLNMAYTSFTLEVWMYAQTLCNSTCSDNAIFGQFDNNTLDHSLHIIVRNQRIYFGLFNDDLTGNQVSEA